MISLVVVLNYQEMEVRMRQRPPGCFVVSITDPGTPPLVIDDDRTIAIQCHDADERAPSDYVLITAEQARRIVDMLERAEALEAPVDVYVNCMAGMCRSAAVARYIVETTEAKVWYTHAPFPNNYIVRMLYRAKREKEAKP